MGSSYFWNYTFITSVEWKNKDVRHKNSEFRICTFPNHVVAKICHKLPGTKLESSSYFDDFLVYRFQKTTK